jgi:integrase/recombinase XerC
VARKYVRYVTDEKYKNVSDENKQIIKKYFNFKNMNLSESTKKSYENDFKQWLYFIYEQYHTGIILEENIIKLLNRKDGIEEMVDLLEDYIAFCSAFLGNNERRIQRRLSSISSFFLYLRKKRKIKENPLDFLERPSLRAGEKQQIVQNFLSEDEINEIRKGLKEMDNLQLEVYFEISLSTMARVNAIANIKINQIDFDKGIIEEVLEKEGYLVDLFPSDNALQLTQKLINQRKKDNIDSEYLFITNYGNKYNKVSKTTIQTSWIKKIGNIIGKNLHSHDLRHSASSILFNKGMPLEDVQKLLNHQSPDTTLKYYVRQDVKKLQEQKRNFEI